METQAGEACILGGNLAGNLASGPDSTPVRPFRAREARVRGVRTAAWGLSGIVVGCGLACNFAGEFPDFDRSAASGSAAETADDGSDEEDVGGDGDEADSEDSSSPVGCGFAEALSGTIPESYEGAVDDGSDNQFHASCVERAARERTLRWEAPRDGEYRVQVDAGPELDPVVYLLDADCSSVSTVLEHCSDDADKHGDGVYAAVEVDLKAYEQITFSVELYDRATHRPATGEFSVNIDEVAVCEPFGDENVVSGTTKGGSKSFTAGTDCPHSEGVERAFVWTAERAGFYTFELQDQSGIDHSLHLHPEICGNNLLTCHSSDWVEPGSRTRVTRKFGEDESVTVVVDTSPDEDGGRFRLEVEEASCPRVDADEFGSGAPLVFEGDLRGQEDHHWMKDCSTSKLFTPDISHHWVAEEPGTYIVTTAGSDTDTVIGAFQGDCLGAEIACNDHNLPEIDAEIRIKVYEDDDPNVIIVVEAARPDSLGKYRLDIQKESDLRGPRPR